LDTPSPRHLALGLEAEWVQLKDRTLARPAPADGGVQLRDDIVVFITEVETLLSLAAHEKKIVDKARQLLAKGRAHAAMVALHPVIYTRGRRD
jgi:hypothetical protein